MLYDHVQHLLLGLTIGLMSNHLKLIIIIILQQYLFNLYLKNRHLATKLNFHFKSQYFYNEYYYQLAILEHF